MKRLVLASAGVIAVGTGAVGAATFDDVYYFGDSLTDCCIRGPYTQDQGGEPTPNWAMQLPGLIGADFTATVENDRAVGGAQSARVNVNPATDTSTGYDTGYLNQIDRFIADGTPVDEEDLIGIWIGTNDIWPSARPGSLAGLNVPLGPQRMWRS